MAESIVGLIKDDGFQPGAEIPSEAELARRFGVSRLVVREAVRTLVAREILVSSQGRPAQVTVPSARVLGQILEFRLHQRTLEFADLLDARRLIEVELAGRAARRVADGEADPTRGARLLATALSRAPSRDRFIDLDLAFHEEIADLAGGETLQMMLASLSSALRAARMASYEGRERRGKGQAATLEHHRLILEAIAAGDTARARAAMAEHLAETERDLAHRPPRQ
ncbi:MAG TPA: FCD domain-containing protein [Streptosporangiales bacterium]